MNLFYQRLLTNILTPHIIKKLLEWKLMIFFKTLTQVCCIFVYKRNDKRYNRLLHESTVILLNKTRGTMVNF